MGGITDGGISSDEKREKEMENGRKKGILVKKKIKEGKETNKSRKRKGRERKIKEGWERRGRKEEFDV